MKKKTLPIFLMLLFLFTAFTAVTYAAANNDLVITLQIDDSMMRVNGVEKEIDAGMATKPTIINDRILLPVRAVVEEMGGTADWNDEQQTITLTYEQNAIRLTIAQTTAYLNDGAYTLDAAPIVLNGRTMLPIRFIAESFGFTVDWNPEQQLVTIANHPANAETSNPVNVSNEQSETVKTLVVYFSGTGNTKTLAETIAATAGADLYEIVPEQPYTSEDLNYHNDNCRANQEMNDDDARPAITGHIDNFSEYDTILIGYPIWWGTAPRIIDTFFDTYDLSNKTIMPFCTSGGSGIETSVSHIRTICPNATVTNGLRGSASTTSASIEQWLNENNFPVQ